MQLSYNGVKFLKDQEGFRSEAYLDTGGVWTIGYGTIKIDGIPVKQGDSISEVKAEECLLSDIAWAQTCVNQNVEVPLRQTQFDALVSLVYNIGCDAFMKSTLLKLLNLQLYDMAAGQFERWVMDNGKRIQGLVNRRTKERKIFEQ